METRAHVAGGRSQRDELEQLQEELLDVRRQSNARRPPGETMSLRRASCSCGQLHLVCAGEPVRVSMCHCLACQRRTGSAFGVQARFRREEISAIEGRSTSFVRVADSGNSVTFHFCPVCGTTVYWELSALPDFVAVAVGAFADPGFPAPKISVYEQRRHSWALPTGIELEHLD